jgi:hypothetical protein
MNAVAVFAAIEAGYVGRYQLALARSEWRWAAKQHFVELDQPRARPGKRPEYIDEAGAGAPRT